jgi:ribosomal protein L17
MLHRFSAVKTLFPPNLCVESVRQWERETDGVCATWTRHVDSCAHALVDLEQSIEHRIADLRAELEAEVLEYGSITTADQCADLLRQHVEPVLEERRAAAHALISQFEEYLHYQVRRGYMLILVSSVVLELKNERRMKRMAAAPCCLPDSVCHPPIHSFCLPF